MKRESQSIKPNSSPDPAVTRVLARKCACGNHTNDGQCETCARKRSGTLQRKPVEVSNPTTVPPIVDEVLSSPGHPLDRETRSSFEQSFGADFSRVRVHADDRAEVSAEAVDAAAYTVGQNVVFGRGQFDPQTHKGQKLLAHELTHTLQQSRNASPSTGTLKIGAHDAFEQEADELASKHVEEQSLYFSRSVHESPTSGTLQRTPAAPTADGKTVPMDTGKVNLSEIPDIVTVANPAGGLKVPGQTVNATIGDPKITHLTWELYNTADQQLDAYSTLPGPKALDPFVVQNTDPHRSQWTPVQGKHVLRCVGLDDGNKPIAYNDRNFYLWTSTPTANYAGLVRQRGQLEATTKKGSGKSLGEVGSAFANLKDVTHDISILETGKGIYEGKKCAVKTAGVVPTDCTDIVLEVLGNVFAQQGRAADWAKVQKKYAENTKARAGTKGLSGVDVQAALQSECGWKGIYWAPDPKYQVPHEQLSGARSDEAEYTAGIAKTKGTYFKDFGKKGYPGVSIVQSVTNYAPEAPNMGFGTASKTTKDTTQLDKLKKLPFGVLSAHGGYHMTIISYGKVIEVHWSKEATSMDVIEQTNLEQWAVGPQSGFHYYASGVIVAPASEVEAAFK